MSALNNSQLTSAEQELREYARSCYERMFSVKQCGDSNSVEPLDYRPGIDYQIGRDC